MKAMLDWLRRYGGYIAVEVGINIVLPIIVFDRMQPHYGEVKAVIGSGVPPLAWAIIGLIRERKLDLVSTLMLVGIAASALTFLVGGSPKLLLMRDNLGGALFGILFLGSAALKRPIMYSIIRDFVERGGAGDGGGKAKDARADPATKRPMMVLTIVFGFGLIFQAFVLAFMVWALSIHNYLVYGPIVGWIIFGGFLAWSIPYYQRATQRARKTDGGAASGGIPPVQPIEV